MRIKEKHIYFVTMPLTLLYALILILPAFVIFVTRAKPFEVWYDNRIDDMCIFHVWLCKKLRVME